MHILKNAVLVSFLVVGLSACHILSSLQSMKQMSKGKLESEDFLLEIPFEFSNGHIIIEANLSGKKGKFYFDSGAGSILFGNRTETRDFKKIGKLTSKAAGGESLEMSIVSVPSLTIGLAQFSDLSFRVFEDFNFQCTDEIIGIIGYSSLRHAHWQIDYDRQIIRFSDQLEKLTLTGQKIDLLVNRFTYEPQVNLHVNDSSTIRFTFDTGNAGGILADLESFEKISSKQLIHFNGGRSSGLSQSPGPMFRDSTLYKVVDGLKLGSIQLGPTIVDYKSPKGLNLLGNEVLKNYLVTLSWEKKVVWLDKQKVPDLYLANLQYHLINGAWTLSAIENQTQKAYGLMPGDQLVSVNGKPWEEINLCEPLPPETLLVFHSQKTKQSREIIFQNLLTP